jgi:hypothetical protein
MWRYVLYGMVFLGAVLRAAPARGADSDWTATVRLLAAEIASGNPEARFTSILAPDFKLRSFGAETESSLQELFSRGAGAIPFVARGMTFPLTDLHMALTHDLAAASHVPSATRWWLQPPEKRAERINKVANGWFRVDLGCKDGTPVGLIVYWLPTLASQPERGPCTEVGLLFVLVRGERQTDGSWRIAQLVYGDPLLPR